MNKAEPQLFDAPKYIIIMAIQWKSRVGIQSVHALALQPADAVH